MTGTTCDSPPPTPKSVFGERHKQIVMVSIGLLLAFLQKSIMSIGVVAMADPGHEDVYPVVNYKPAEKGIVLSAFLYGYVAGCLPMGILISKLGPVKVLSISGGILSLFTACLPLVAIYLGYVALCVTRAIQGIMFGGFMPGIHAMVCRWVVPHEREKFGWVYLGSQSWAILNSFLGLLSASPAGWPSLYYVTGLVGLLWSLMFLNYGMDNQEESSKIAEDERQYLKYYLKDERKQSRKLKDLPWLPVLTSVPVWACIFTQASERWCHTVFNNFTPSFLRGVYDFNIASNGFLSSLPAVSSLVFTFLFSFIGGHISRRVSQNFSRKLWTSVGCYGSCLFYVILGTVDVGAAEAVILLTIGNGLFVGNVIGVMMNSIDLSPNWASILTGFIWIPTSLAAISANTVTGFTLYDEHSLPDWQRVFLILAAISFVGGTVFLLFGSTSIQYWDGNKVTSKSKDSKIDNC